MKKLALKPLIKESHHIILSDDGDICIGEIPSVSQIIPSPPAWAIHALTKMDGKRTIPRITKELNDDGHNVTNENIQDLVAGLIERNLLQDNSFCSVMLSNEEIERYNRQILQFSLIDADRKHPLEYQEQLKKSKITIFGMGGWGTWCALQLAMAGIGTLNIIDGDDVELSNINRQVLYKTSDIGKNKVDAAKETIRSYNHNVNVNTFFEFATTNKSRLEEIIDNSNFIVLAWAALAYYRKNTVEEIIHEIAKEKKIPIIELGGDPLEVSVGPIYPYNTNCPTIEEIKHIVKNEYYSNDHDIKKFQEARLKHSFKDGDRQVNAWQSSPSLSILSGIAVDQIVKFITGYDTPHLIGKRFNLSLQNFQSSTEVLFK